MPLSHADNRSAALRHVSVRSRAAEEPSELLLSDGSSASVVGDALLVRDSIGRILVRYSNGSAEIAAPDGDLVLAAPNGRVVVRSGSDVDIEAANDVRQRAGGAMEVRAARLTVDAGEASAVVKGPLTVLAQQIATSAEILTQNVSRFELTATRLVEKTRDAFRDTSDLAQTRVGRARTIVGDVYALFSRRTTMVSNEDTSIDGRKILLG